jgi:hypothetical protein
VTPPPSRATNPNAHELRKRLHKMYFVFRPPMFYWALVIILRKFLIAITALLFNRQPSFQLATLLLVLFVAYAAQVGHLSLRCAVCAVL